MPGATVVRRFVFPLPIALLSLAYPALCGGAGPDWSRGYEEIATLTGHKQGIAGAVFSPCGKYFTLSNKDFFLNIWDSATGKSLAKMEGLNTWPEYVAFSPDGAVLGAGDYEKVRLWKVPSGEELTVLEGGEGPIAWRPAGEYLAAKSRNNSGTYGLVLFALPGGEVTARVDDAHTNLVRQVTWTPDGSMLASSSDDGTLKLWDGKSLAETRVLQGEGKVGRFCFSPDGVYVAAISGKDPGGFFTPAAVLVWEVAGGKQVLKIDEFKKGLEAVCYSPGGATLVTGDRSNRLVYWEIPSGNMVKEFGDHKYWVSRLVFSPDGRFLAATTADEVEMRDADSGEKLWSVVAATQGLTGLSFSPDGSRLIVTSTDNTAKLFAPKE